MGVSQKILKVCQPKIISTQFFLPEDFDVIFFHNMFNWYKFAEKMEYIVELLNVM
jgi:hypothetical protein